jgi:hypothetical protein
MSTLEQRYAEKEAADQTTVAKIRQACGAFMQRHPEYLPTQANEQILFAAMSAPANDHLVPTSVASWEDVYAQCRERLEQKPAASQQRRSPVKPGLTHDDIDRMSAIEYQRRIESDPAFSEQVNALGPRK